MMKLTLPDVSQPHAERILTALRALEPDELEPVIESLATDANMTLMNVGLALCDTDRLTEAGLVNRVAHALEVSMWDDVSPLIDELTPDTEPWASIRAALIELDKAWSPYRDLRLQELVMARDNAAHWSVAALDAGMRADFADEAKRLTAQIAAYKPTPVTLRWDDEGDE